MKKTLPSHGIGRTAQTAGAVEGVAQTPHTVTRRLLRNVVYLRHHPQWCQRIGGVELTLIVAEAVSELSATSVAVTVCEPVVFRVMLNRCDPRSVAVNV